MSEQFTCPRCQFHALVAMPEPHRYACMACRKIWDIRDVLKEIFSYGQVTETRDVVSAEVAKALVDACKTVEAKGGGA